MPRLAGVAIEITGATPADLPAIAALLRQAELPHDDIGRHLDRFLVARVGGEIIGAIGAEVGGPDALLRSLVVAARARGVGLGNKLFGALDAAAGSWGVQRWWLLTTTADSFFARLGFSAARRSSAPAAIQRTGQFSGACCGSARCMTRERRAAE
jgi:amino-acid N-acetyltransferase